MANKKVNEPDKKPVKKTTPKVEKELVKKPEPKTTKKLDKKQIIFLSVVGAVVIISLLLIISGLFGNFESVNLKENDKDIFTIKDLSVNNLKFLSTSEEVVKELGKPKSTKKVTKNNYEYMEYYYSGLKLTLKENYDDYALVGAEITSRKYKIGRDIKVGNKVLNVINKFKVESESGNYIYKNYTIDALNDNLVKDNAYFGYRDTEEIRYYNKDAVIEGNPTNVAELKFNYRFGRINKITWSYDVR